MTQHPIQALPVLRQRIRDAHRADEVALIDSLCNEQAFDSMRRARIVSQAVTLVNDIRSADDAGLMEAFLAEYGLATDEGLALMTLAEALLRVPDEATVDALIEDKIANQNWTEHASGSESTLINLSTQALMLTGTILRDADEPSVMSGIRSAVKKLGVPIIRQATRRAMQELGQQFVLGQTVQEAIAEGASYKAKGYLYSYDMLGEAALTQPDADVFFNSYSSAIDTLTAQCRSSKVRENPGISIKLSALHPRYEPAQKDRVMQELVPRVVQLAKQARNAHMGFNIDAEEAYRLDLSLDVIEAVLATPELAGWNGFGVVVQAYGKRCTHVIDWLHALSTQLDRRIMVRLVKGAYWDTEIKEAQTLGVSDFPVYTIKEHTDVSYLCCAAKLLGLTDRLYPQFATHNAHTVSAILELAESPADYEFQRLHGMGEALHATLVQQHQATCRIYAPVGEHRDLLAYLVRRLLENGANSSFVNKLMDTSVLPEVLAADPFLALDRVVEQRRAHNVQLPSALYPDRVNSRGWDTQDPHDCDELFAARAPFAKRQWHVTALMAVEPDAGNAQAVINPFDRSDTVGSVRHATANDAQKAVSAARPWTDASQSERAAVLLAATDCMEARFGELFAVLAREAGKTPLDAIAELREAVDFLRYYATEARHLESDSPRGVVVCISPWNFPLAIFLGQISASLSVGNAVVAKPAEPTPIIAWLAVSILHEAGVPRDALQLLPGTGADIGTALTSDARVSGVCFTGSTGVAQRINQSMASSLAPEAPLVAETGGLNAMVVDSTALPEQAVRDIVASAFQSAGQRCSALRILCLQEDIEASFMRMLTGAMDELVLDDPWQVRTDVGPIIHQQAHAGIAEYVNEAQLAGRLIKQLALPPAVAGSRNMIGPALIRISHVSDVTWEVFGPVLHVMTFNAARLDTVLDDINALGYGLTFGLHTRIEGRVDAVTEHMRVGNVYVNRNQIGAVVGSQPFGGEGLSGTGPKAGGPQYLRRFVQAESERHEPVLGEAASIDQLQTRLDAAETDASCRSSEDLPGPSGELNRLSQYARGRVLCLGPTLEAALLQRDTAHARGCAAVIVVPGAADEDGVNGYLERATLAQLRNLDVVALFSNTDDQSTARRALADRDGPIIPLATSLRELNERCILERHLCVDTTAAGGNASLLAG